MYSQDQLDEIAYRLNNRPRKVLKFRTSDEVYDLRQDHLLKEQAAVALGS